MIVVVDSGSTKTDWKFIEEESGEVIYSRKTIGFNPYYHDSIFISEELKQSFSDIKLELNSVSKIYFYGAGCSSAKHCQRVESGLQIIFVNAVISVEHDLLGACRATLGNKPGIACIIGTGSNSCVWDGEQILSNIPSHGFIFGDEGSGARLGQELLKLYFNNELPESVTEDFLSKFHPIDSEILENVYRGTNPNVFLARYARFYSEHKDNVILNEVVYKALCEFYYKRVIKYDNHRQLKLGFVGSIAYHFQQHVKKIAAIHGMSVFKIEQCPIDGLVEFHTTPVLSKITKS